MDKNANRRKNDFIKNCRIIFKDNEYEYSDIEFTYASQIVKNIHCNKHNVYFDVDKASNHYNKKIGCNSCNNMIIVKNEPKQKIDYKKNFIEKIQKIFPDNDYSEIIYTNSNKLVKNIICKKHGSFDICGDNHLNQLQNCNKCPYISHKSGEKLKSIIVYLNDTKIFNDINYVLKDNKLSFKHHNKCIYCNSINYTIFGSTNLVNPNVCIDCKNKDEKYINLITKKCIITDCKHESTSGDINEKVRIMCVAHGNLFGYKNLQKLKIEEINNKIIEDANENKISTDKIILFKSSKKCKYGVCGRDAAYNDKGKKGVLYCSTHNYLLKDPVHQKQNPRIKCVQNGCTEWANYALERNKKAKEQYCYNHRKENYYNIFKDHCMLCNTSCCFGIIKDGKYKNLWCNICSIKLKEQNPDLQIITKPSCNRNKKCSIQNCTGTGSYINENDERVCINHYDENTCKKDNNELKRECVIEDCTNRGVIETKNGDKYCISCSKSIDQDEIKVKNKKNNVKTFHETDNIENLLKVALYEKTIEQLNNRYRCVVNGCTTIPSYRYEDDRMPQYCKLHAKYDMIITSRTTLCKSCKEIYTHDEKCFRCMNPNTQIRKKESMIVGELKKIYPNLTNNKEIIGGSSKYRPDIFISLDNHNIIIEIDENQHSKYENELSRLEDLSNDLNDDKYQIFIRFNPDKYDKKNKSILDDENEFKERMQILLESIEILTSENETRVVYLFYDKF